jgi:three-Cys-motif partner protein
MGKVINTFNEPLETWGGPWTEKKLNAFENYVKAYLKIMLSNPYWETIYFDGFAGSGDKGDGKNALYHTLNFSEEEERIYQGAAERVSRLDEPNRFCYYYFIEKDNKSITQLKEKIQNLNAGKKGKQEFRAGDCNGELIKLATALHKTKTATSKSKKYSALIFLDPFGMQVEWDAIGKLNDTKSDVWILLPTAVIVNRLLDQKGKLKSIKKLESFFGLKEEEIKKHFYILTGQQDLFDSDAEKIKKIAQPIEKIAELYIKKMKTIWKYVTEKPLRLDNRSGGPLFHFVFASNNENALKIANDIIKNV